MSNDGGKARAQQGQRQAAIDRLMEAFAEDVLDVEEFERRLYLVRRRCRKAIHHHDRYFYVASLSCRVIAYKGLGNLGGFTSDLAAAIDVVANAYLNGGLGQAPDRAKAQQWLQRGADAGYEPAKEKLEQLADPEGGG